MKTILSGKINAARHTIASALLAATFATVPALILQAQAPNAAARRAKINTATWGQPTFGAVGDNVLLTAKVQVAANLLPVSGVPVTFLLNTTRLGTAVTDSGGRAHLTLQFSQVVTRGVTAVFAGDATYGASQARGFVTIQPRKVVVPPITLPPIGGGKGVVNHAPAQPVSAISVSPAAIDVGRDFDTPIHIHAIVKDKPLAFTPIAIHITDQTPDLRGTMLIKTTNGNGDIDFRYHPNIESPPPSKLSFPLHFTIEASYSPPGGAPPIGGSNNLDVYWK